MTLRTYPGFQEEVLAALRIVLNRLEDCGDISTWKGQGDNKRKDQDDTSARQDEDDISEPIVQDDSSDRIDPDGTGALLVLERDDSSVLLDPDDISEQRGVCVVTLFWSRAVFPLKYRLYPLPSWKRLVIAAYFLWAAG